MGQEVNTKDFEATLLNSLRGIKGKADVKPVATVLSGYIQQGMVVEKIRWIGIFDPDFVNISGRLPANRIKVIEGLLQDKKLTGLRLFPKGVPPLEKVFDLEVEIAV
jgi:hypothetical protein